LSTFGSGFRLVVRRFGFLRPFQCTLCSSLTFFPKPFFPTNLNPFFKVACCYPVRGDGAWFCLFYESPMTHRPFEPSLWSFGSFHATVDNCNTTGLFSRFGGGVPPLLQHSTSLYVFSSLRNVPRERLVKNNFLPFFSFLCPSARRPLAQPFPFLSRTTPRGPRSAVSPLFMGEPVEVTKNLTIPDSLAPPYRSTYLPSFFFFFLAPYK